MRKKAAFLDRDGTLIFDPGYLHDPAQVQLLPAAADAVAALRDAGYHPVIITNQSGVGRGYYALDAVHAVNQRMAALLAELHPSAIVRDFYICPHAPDDGCGCRKPLPGLLLQAADAL